jgi:hypothetical protein
MLIESDVLLKMLQDHLDCTHMSVCSSIKECKARRDEIQNAIELVKAQPPVEVKLRTDEDILSVGEAIETINRLRKAYCIEKSKTERSKGCVWCEEDNKVFHDGQHFHFFCSYCGRRLLP